LRSAVTIELGSALTPTMSDNGYYVKSVKTIPARRQSNSDSSSSFTRSLLILGPPAGISKTTNPFTTRVGIGDPTAFRTNSEAAYRASWNGFAMPEDFYSVVIETQCDPHGNNILRTNAYIL
jgi:hypothetical protein